MLPLSMPRRRSRRALNPRRACGYVRTSKARQELSPGTQRDLLERWAEENEVELVAVFEDIGLSGGADLEDAPGLQDALAALEERDAGILLAVHRDRFARGLLRAALVDALAERVGARCLTVEDALDEEGEDELLRRGFKDLFSAYERQRIRARTRNALRKLRREGVVMGKPPFGWAWSAEDELDEHGRRYLVENVEEQRTLTRIRRLRERGLSLRKLGEQLERDGLLPRSGGRWHPATIAQVLGYQPPHVRPLGPVRGARVGVFRGIERRSTTSAGEAIRNTLDDLKGSK